MKSKLKKAVAIACSLSMVMQMSVSAAPVPETLFAEEAIEEFPEDTEHTKEALAQGDENGDAVTRKDLWTMNMIHNNPGLEPYESPYNDSEFLQERNIDGHVFFLYDCAQFGVLWDKFDALNGVTLTQEEYLADPENPEIKAQNEKKVLPYGSEERQWEVAKKADILDKYDKAKEAGRQVMFMMDTIAVPAHLKELYKSEICSGNNIDIKKEKTKQVLDCLMEEMLVEFPQIDAVTFRFGETYVGSKYGAGAPYHVGNNPILDESYHKEFVDHMAEWLYGDRCPDGKARDLIYRNWVHGAFQHDPKTYLRITDEIEPNEHLYMCIKHTDADFARYCKFNPIIGIGKHQQIVEVQCAREYEGKGAFPNYMGDGVINGFEEYDRMYGEDSDQAQCLRDVVNCENSLVKGVWTWDRGGGWNGPYLTGVNGIVGNYNQNDHSHEVIIQNGSELWCDLNTYVITQWFKDTSKTDKYYVKQYAEKYLGMNEEDAENFYKLCILSARAVMLGKYGENHRYGGNYWMRDNIVQGLGGQSAIAKNEDAKKERLEGIALWKEMIAINDSFGDYLYDQQLPDSPVSVKSYIDTTCKYGYYFFDLIYQTALAVGTKEMGDSSGNYDTETIMNAVSEYDRLWREWEELYETAPGCPSLFMKEDKNYNFLGYSSGGGFDGAMKKARPQLTVDKNRQVEVGKSFQSVAKDTFGGKLTYLSNNPEVATVDETGRVTGVSEGYAKITVSTAGNEPLVGVFMVKVVPSTGDGQGEDDTYETVFTEDFSSDVSSQWVGGGTKTWQPGSLTLSQRNGDVASFDLPKQLEGKLTITFKMKVDNPDDRAFFQLANANGKHITQVEFRGSKVAPNGCIIIDKGSADFPALLEGYQPDTYYDVKIVLNTETQEMQISVNDGTPVALSSYKEGDGANTALAKLNMGVRDSSALTVSDIKIVREKAEDTIYETLFAEDFSEDVSEKWVDGGTKTWQPGSLTLSQRQNDVASFTLPQPIEGEAIITFKMKVNNPNDRAFFQLANANGKHITQVEFRGSVNSPKGCIIIDKGTADFPKLLEGYQADTYYDVKIVLDTRTQNMIISVNDGKPVNLTSYKQSDGPGNTALAKLNIGVRDNAALTISDIKIVRETVVDIPIEEIVKVTDVNETVLKGSNLAFTPVPYGYELQVAKSEPSGIFDKNGKVLNRPAEDTEVKVSLQLADIMNTETAPVPMDDISVEVKAGRQLHKTTGVFLDQRELTLSAGEMDYLTSEITPENSDNKSVTWDSSNWDVVTVSQSGRVTAVAPGTADITVTSRDDERLSAKCTVEVLDTAQKYSILVENGNANKEQAAAGETVTITASPSDAERPFKKWAGADDLEFVNNTTKESEKAQFKMPAKDVELRALYEGDEELKVVGIRVASGPDKDTYILGETFEPEGLKVNAQYAVASASEVVKEVQLDKEEYTLDTSAFDEAEEQGTYPIHVTYEFEESGEGREVSADFNVKVLNAENARTLEVVNGSAIDEHAYYEEGDKVLVQADEETDDQIFSGWEVTEGDAVLATPSDARTTVVIGKENSVITALFDDIRDWISSITEIFVDKEPVKTEYKLGEEFNPAGLVVKAKGILKDSSDEENEIAVIEDNTKLASPSDAAKVTAYAEGGLGIEEGESGTDQTKDDTKLASSSDATRVFTLREGEYEIDDSEYDADQPGKYEITVSYEFTNENGTQVFHDSFWVEVLDEEVDDEDYYVTDIVIKRQPDKKTYRVDDEIDLEGLVVVARVKGVDTGNRLDDLILTDDDYDVRYDFSVSGRRKVTIEYWGPDKKGNEHKFTDSFMVTVIGTSSSDSDSDGSYDIAINNPQVPLAGLPGTTERPAYATDGSWKQTGDQWTFVNAAGETVKSAWACVFWNGTYEWYHFDENGQMQTGWLTIDGQTFYLQPQSNGTRGTMLTGWQQIDGIWYYFNNVSDGSRGKLLVNTTTPDGYKVDEKGRWIQ